MLSSCRNHCAHPSVLSYCGSLWPKLPSPFWGCSSCVFGGGDCWVRVFDARACFFFSFCAANAEQGVRAGQQLPRGLRGALGAQGRLPTKVTTTRHPSSAPLAAPACIQTASTTPCSLRFLFVWFIVGHSATTPKKSGMATLHCNTAPRRQPLQGTSAAPPQTASARCQGRCRSGHGL